MSIQLESRTLASSKRIGNKPNDPIVPDCEAYYPHGGKLLSKAIADARDSLTELVDSDCHQYIVDRAYNKLVTLEKLRIKPYTCAEI